MHAEGSVYGAVQSTSFTLDCSLPKGHFALEGNTGGHKGSITADVSRSGAFGTRVQTKRDMLAEIAAVLSFSAILNNDKVGALLFSDKVELFRFEVVRHY